MTDGIEGIDPPDHGSFEDGFEELAALLDEMADVLARARPAHIARNEWLEVCARIGELIVEFDGVRRRISRALGYPSARSAILKYFQNHLGEVLNRDQIKGVAGIDDWARRVRELRVEEGYRISSQENRQDLSPGQYVLEALEPDAELAEQWQTAKRIRNASGSAKDRILELLQLLHPRPADMEQLAYVAKIQEWPRRMRELSEEGWQVVSNVDDPSLAPGSYRLDSQERLPPRARQAIQLRHQILERDNRSCQRCGRTPNKDGVRLQIHHKILVKDGGTNEPSNLLTLCSDCHAGVHSVEEGSTEDELTKPEAEPDTLTEEL
jgi:hypothetical protein